MHDRFQSVTSLLEDLASRMPAAAGHAGSPGRHDILLDNTGAEANHPGNDLGRPVAHRSQQIDATKDLHAVTQQLPPTTQSCGRHDYHHALHHHSHETQRLFASPYSQARQTRGDATGIYSPEPVTMRDGARVSTGVQQRSGAVEHHQPTVPTRAGCRGESRPRPPVMPTTHGAPYLPVDTDACYLPQTMSDLEGDINIQERVAKALQAALLPESRGKQSHPHHFIYRGPKRDKTVLDELTMCEYLAGFLELMELRPAESEEKAFMYQHLSRILKNARNYDWPSVRSWSEEVCTRISEGKLTWQSTYEIDRMELEMAHGRRLAPGSESKSAPGSGYGYDVDPSILKARPGPPCRAYQTGQCTHPGDHITNRQRSLHVCAYCIYYKCSLLPHPEKECRAKHNSYTHQSGFGK